MRIVALDQQSAPLLENLAEDVFDHAIDASSLQAFLDCPRHIMHLAIDDGLVVGMASAVEYFHPDKSPQLWINEIGVTPSKRNQGIGRQLISSLVAAGKKRGCVYAWLGTDHDNVPAQRCFDAVPGGETPQKFLLYEWELADDSND